MASKEISKYKQDVPERCTLCGLVPWIDDHLKFACHVFDPVWHQADPEISNIPAGCLPKCIKVCVAPAMQMDGEKTFPGDNIDPTFDKKSRQLLGENLSLPCQGRMRRRRRRKG